MKRHHELLLKLFEILNGYKPQEPKLFDHLSEVMEGQYYPEDTPLFKEGDIIDKAFYLASGTVITYIYNEDGEKQVLDIFQANEIIAGKSFMEHSASDAYLSVCADSYVLSITYEQMKVVYQDFPGTEELARIILAARESKDLRRRQMLIHPGTKMIREFYQQYPELRTPGKPLRDADIASFLLISESSLRSIRSKIKEEDEIPDNKISRDAHNLPE